MYRAATEPDRMRFQISGISIFTGSGGRMSEIWKRVNCGKDGKPPKPTRSVEKIIKA